LLDSWGHLQQRRGSSPRVCGLRCVTG
jgi:hypothetical protein